MPAAATLMPAPAVPAAAAGGATAATHRPPPALLVLRRALLWRLGLAVALVVAGLAAAGLHDWQQRSAAHLPATASLVAQLLHDDLTRHTSPFSRLVARLDPAPLQPLAQRAAFCVRARDLVEQPVLATCLPAVDAAPLPLLDRLAAALAHAAGHGLHAELPLMVAAGIKAGTIRVEPHWVLEGRGLLRQGLTLAAAGAALVAGLVMAARLVARALAPANQVLDALGRLARGEPQVRLPPMALAELHHIGEGFNRMAEALQTLERRQQQLAGHLLQAREAERRRLARDLHDELGQSLTALQAEAAAMRLMTAAVPPAAAGAQAMCDTTARLLDGLQRVLTDLRPQALDDFGLPLALRALTQSPQRRRDGGLLQVRLHLDEPWAALPPDHDIHVYRLVQEALTNIRRHSRAGRADIWLRRDAREVHLEVVDDGHHEPCARLEPGHGMLGMRERVQALGGQAQWFDVPGGGLGLRAHWPVQAGAGVSA